MSAANCTVDILESLRALDEDYLPSVSRSESTDPWRYDALVCSIYVQDVLKTLCKSIGFGSRDSMAR